MSSYLLNIEAHLAKSIRLTKVTKVTKVSKVAKSIRLTKVLKLTELRVQVLFITVQECI